MPAGIRQAWRSWMHAKGVALLAVVTLAAGIGSTTAIYTVVNAVMLRPLSYEHGERFASLLGGSTNEPEGRSSLSPSDLLEYQRSTSSFDVFGWFTVLTFNLTSPGAPQKIDGTALTPGLAEGVGVQPVIGRWFQNETEAVISRSLWMRLGGDPSIPGKPLVLNGRVYSISGVMPAGFRLPETSPGNWGVHSDVWIMLDPSGRDQQGYPLFGYARLKPGVPFAQARADVLRVAAEIARRDPAGRPAYTAHLDPLQAIVVKEIRPTLLLLMAAAGLLFLIACANVSGLLLTRSVSRARETAIRVALGASARQLARQYFLEGLVVSLAGAVAGVAVSIALVRIVVSLAAEFIPRHDEVALDWTVLLFALLAAILSTILACLSPLWQALRTRPNDALSEGVRASSGAGSRRLSRALVSGEIALAFTLLAVSAVLLTHLDRLTRTWPGFDANGVLTFHLTLPDPVANRSETRIPHQIRLVNALTAIPGVNGVGFSNQTPVRGCCLSTSLYPDGRANNLDAPFKTAFLPISPGYLDAMRIPLLKGRFLTYHDHNDDYVAVMINATAARHYWGQQDPVGASGRLNGPRGSQFRVVGVTGDTKRDGLGKPPVAEVYMLHTVANVNPMHFVMRSRLPADRVLLEIRRVLRELDPAQPVHDIATMNEVVRNSVNLERVASFMVGFFALAAVLMASLGIYAIVAYSVRQRTVEFGTRMALGAVSRDLLVLVVGGGIRMAAYGIVLGGIAVIAAVWALMSQFHIQQVGILPFAGSTAAIAAIAMTASLFPAWRASRLSPMVAIRDDPGSAWLTFRRTLKGIAAAVSSHELARTPPDEGLLGEFVEAARTASSFAEAERMAMTTLCERVGVRSAVLLEKVSADEYRGVMSTEGGPLSCAIPARGLLIGRLRFHALPLPLASGDFETCIRWAEEYRPDHVAEIRTLSGAGARLAVALRGRNEIIGVLLLGEPIGRAEYSIEEKRLIGRCGDQFALMIENARLTTRLIEQEKLRRDLALAAEVQQRLLPQRAPAAAVAQLAGMSVPARTIGGDYYDFLEAGDHTIGIALADIAGKGVAAALIMSVVQASLRVIAAEGGISLPQLAAKMNRFLHRSTGSSSYATFFYAQMDERSRQLRYVNAGHNPPYLVRSLATDGVREIQELPAGGTVLGLFPQAGFEEACVDLRSGDVLVAFTDGVTEALNPNEEEFGEERLKDLLRRVVHLPVPEIVSRISEELKTWIRDAAQHDDLTFVVMKVN